MPTALDLFERFAPRFSRVRLVPISYDCHNDTVTLEVFRGKEDRLLFRRHNHPTLKFGQASSSLNFKYDSRKRQTAYEQFENALFRRVRELLKGKTFYLSPVVTPTRLDDGRGGWEEIRLKLEMKGRSIHSLKLPDERSQFPLIGTLMTLIAMDSPEGKAIHTRLRYENTLQLTPRDITAEQQQARACFEEALTAVAA